MDLSDQMHNLSVSEHNQKKREDYIDWPDYFMATAFLAAKRSKDPNFQVGACIVNEENIIVGIGYNGMPKGCSDDEFPWDKNTSCSLDSKSLYVCHAEMNAILNKNSADVKNCTMYVGLFPCNECAKIIIQSGISEVVYFSDKGWDKPKYVASRRMLDAAGIKHRYHHTYKRNSRPQLADFWLLKTIAPEEEKGLEIGKYLPKHNKIEIIFK